MQKPKMRTKEMADESQAFARSLVAQGLADPKYNQYRPYIFQQPGDYNEQEVEPIDIHKIMQSIVEQQKRDRLMNYLKNIISNFQVNSPVGSILNNGPMIQGRVGPFNMNAGVGMLPSGQGRPEYYGGVRFNRSF